MKRTLLFFALIALVPAGALAQGQIVFNNRVFGQVSAPVFGPQGNDPTSTLMLHGNGLNAEKRTVAELRVTRSSRALAKASRLRGLSKRIASDFVHRIRKDAF